MCAGIESEVDTVTSAVITGGSGQSDMGKHLKDKPYIINDTDRIHNAYSHSLMAFIPLVRHYCFICQTITHL